MINKTQWLLLSYLQWLKVFLPKNPIYEKIHLIFFYENYMQNKGSSLKFQRWKYAWRIPYFKVLSTQFGRKKFFIFSVASSNIAQELFIWVIYFWYYYFWNISIAIPRINIVYLFKLTRINLNMKSLIWWAWIDIWEAKISGIFFTRGLNEWLRSFQELVALWWNL